MKEIEEEIIKIVTENPGITIEEIIEKSSSEAKLDINLFMSLVRDLLTQEKLITRKKEDETLYYSGDIESKKRRGTTGGRKPVISRKNGMVAACILAICLSFVAMVYFTGPVRYVLLFLGLIAVLLTGLFWIFRS